MNNYYGINYCNTIYVGFWKNKNILFFFLNYLFSLYFSTLLYLSHFLKNIYKLINLIIWKVIVILGYNFYFKNIFELKNVCLLH